MQTTSHLLMIQPLRFGFNPETAVNNAFQVAGASGTAQETALKEFNDFVQVLRKEGVDITVVADTAEPHTPDSIFPNNWVSFHEDGTVVLYPMFAPNRREERKPAVLATIGSKFRIERKIDLSVYESSNIFLEGTGSMVLDREKKIAYACISPRTDFEVLTDFCEKMQYQAVVFDAFDQQLRPIYHTNVMMCVADKYVVICLESIPSDTEREDLISSITGSGKEIIPISFEQMNRFAGNMLQVQNEKGEKLLVMSSAAYRALTAEQVQKLSAFNRIIHSPLASIEANGGGSARCMMAEVHLPLQ